ncbi:MAG: lasso peptide biosynthesis PqqD family chaperone [Bacteroidales bacterium]|nr:lasso peptide biosynthesis PqqD family chaperone [Bacteroidales bacterium]
MIIIDYQSIIQRSNKLVSSNMDGETVMMSIENGEYFGLNSVGSRMWELIENPIKVNTLIELLLDEFDVSREQCEAETMEFLNHLLDKKLLTIIPAK